MAIITIEVPDEIAEQFGSQTHLLVDSLLRSLHQPSLPLDVYRHILKFIASDPTPEQFATFGPTPEMIERCRTLVAKERVNEITLAEKAELDEYDRIEHLMVVIKTQNLPFLTGRS